MVGSWLFVLTQRLKTGNTNWPSTQKIMQPPTGEQETCPKTSWTTRHVGRINECRRSMSTLFSHGWISRQPWCYVLAAFVSTSWLTLQIWVMIGLQCMFALASHNVFAWELLPSLPSHSWGQAWMQSGQTMCHRGYVVESWTHLLLLKINLTWMWDPVRIVWGRCYALGVVKQIAMTMTIIKWCLHSL
jgi:hypothetical protein